METLFGEQPAKPRRTWRFWLFVFSPILVLGTCSVFVIRAKNALSQVQPEIDAFHERMEHQQYSDIYSAAAPAFQMKVQPRALEEYLGGIHEKAGPASLPGNLVHISPIPIRMAQPLGYICECCV